ncbi:hypothetical protein PybrP1_003864, partial [[Pythium] brassicae (nom. inval.)]
AKVNALAAKLQRAHRIREEVMAVASRAAVESDLKEAAEAPKEWNIAKIGADKVWADGNIGQGCGETPRVVHNAWYSFQGDKFFQAQINAWAQAGIVGVFQAGDAGPQCGSVVSPGDSYNSLSVGSISSTNTLSAFSAKGPAPDRVIKPDLLAPGSRVRSATNTGDADYMSTSGTATAAAHVVGTIALMLAANPALDFAR